MRGPEVEHAHSAALRDKHVPGIHIAVNDPALMRMGERGADRIDDRDVPQPPLRAVGVPRNEFGKGQAAQQLHREECDPPVSIELVHPHDIRVRQGLQILKFAAQFREYFGTARDGRMQHFDRECSSRAVPADPVQIDGFEYGAHPTAPEQSRDPISTPQHIADGKIAPGGPALGGWRRVGSDGYRQIQTAVRRRLQDGRAGPAREFAVRAESKAHEIRVDHLKCGAVDLPEPIGLIDDGEHVPRRFRIDAYDGIDAAEEGRRIASPLRQGGEPIACDRQGLATVGAPVGRFRRCVHQEIIQPSRSNHCGGEVVDYRRSIARFEVVVYKM